MVSTYVCRSRYGSRGRPPCPSSNFSRFVRRAGISKVRFRGLRTQCRRCESGRKPDQIAHLQAPMRSSCYHCNVMAHGFRLLHIFVLNLQYESQLIFEEREYLQSSSHTTPELDEVQPSGHTELQVPLEPSTTRRPSPFRDPPTSRTCVLLFLPEIISKVL